MQAVEAAIKSAALEIEHIRFNAVSPGWISEKLDKFGMDRNLGLPVKNIAKHYINLIENGNSGEVIMVAKDI